mmetsp:Transcript_41699/g.82942  ORF Transcript_41699/g.82942 Transcript_41699/m.82942 type:complete len:236 (-) Transcript_41699:163-870(-)
MAINIIFIGAKRVRQLHRDAVQHPQNEDLDEREEPRPHGMRRPLRCDKRRDEPMQDQAAVASLGVLRRERRRRQAKGVVVLHHAVPKLLEDPGEQGRRRRQDALLGVLHDVVLYPSVDQLNLALVVRQHVQAFVVQILGREQLVLVTQSFGRCAGAIFVAGLEVRKCSCMQEAHEPNKHMLEGLDFTIVRLAMRHERDTCAASFEPLRPHTVRRFGSFPPAGVALRGLEHNQEAE